MEAIVTVEFRFALGHKYTSRYLGMEASVVPAFNVPMWFLGMKNREGVGTTVLDLVSEDGIVEVLLKNGYSPLFMKWCMEESRDYGFNPFVTDVDRLRDRSPHVYITHDLDDDLIKVGTSGQLRSRLRSLYANKGHTFKLLGLMQGSHNVERAVCHQFKEHLIAGREWFRPHQEIYDFIAENTFLPSEPVKP